MSKVLILVDLQEEWRDPSSDYFIDDLEDYIEMINELIAFCRSKGYRIIFTRHIEEEGKAFREREIGSKIIGDIEREETDEVIIKNRISPFYETNLDKLLKKENAIIVAGLLTNLGVRSLVFDAYDRDFEIELITDCCRAFDENRHEAVLEDLKETRPTVELLSLEESLN